MNMKKAALAAATTLALAAPAYAQDPLLVVEDPTPTGTFSGGYVHDDGDPQDGRGKDEHGHTGQYEEGYQDGHVAVYEDGVAACNGNPTPLPYDQNGDGSDDAIQGYVWVGSDHAADGDIWPFVAPGEVAGGGSNHGKYSHEPTGEPPCEEADPAGDGPG